MNANHRRCACGRERHRQSATCRTCYLARADLFYRRIHKVKSGCWLWTGPLDRQGYGRKGTRLAHRVLWERLRGPLSGRWLLHHTCETKRCVNPAHLRRMGRGVHTRLHKTKA